MSDRIRMILIILLMLVLGLAMFLVGVTTTIDSRAATPPPGAPPAAEHTTRLVTANIGRRGPAAARQRAVRRVPLGITGWQEIDADDRGREHQMIRRARPAHHRACWNTSVPVTIPASVKVLQERITRLHRAVRPRISARRILCETTLELPGGRHIVVVNTQLIAKAHSGGRQRREATRQRLWSRSWRILRARVDHYADRGLIVYVLGDLNNRHIPTVHPRARTLIGWHNDYVLTVPGVGATVLERRHVRLRIDGHQGHQAVVRR